METGKNLKPLFQRGFSLVISERGDYVNYFLKKYNIVNLLTKDYNNKSIYINNHF